MLKDGDGVFGAHVVAFNLETGDLVGGFSLNQLGEFVIAGLEPGPYVVRAEPLDDVDVEGFFAVADRRQFSRRVRRTSARRAPRRGSRAGRRGGEAEVRRAWLAALVFLRRRGCRRLRRSIDSPSPVASRGSAAIRSAGTRRRFAATTRAATPFTLFRADASIEQAPGAEMRLGFGLTRDLALEVGGTYARPQLAVHFTQDSESEIVTLADEDVSQYGVDGGVVWQVRKLQLGRHVTPFASGGIGYLRQLFADRTEVETGTIMYVGGGVRYFIRGGDTVRHPFGARLEVKTQIRMGGVDVAGKSRVYPVFNVFGFYGF